ncbi:hypothetical protein PVAND_016607 [Polypedilum vanderplanki]|uniref:Uncharacterized protein n=1 Tax=Polypedilum vanderplanki TaxID=319348 RepID=A0A9J6BFL5_POLVA|nr:hypothetical protein PVAND_016607 [Polypedilum vanderplanki]
MSSLENYKMLNKELALKVQKLKVELRKEQDENKELRRELVDEKEKNAEMKIQLENYASGQTSHGLDSLQLATSTVIIIESDEEINESDKMKAVEVEEDSVCKMKKFSIVIKKFDLPTESDKNKRPITKNHNTRSKQYFSL